MLNQSSLRSAMLLSASVLSLLAAPAFAQEAQGVDGTAAQASEDSAPEAIVVTGSRIQQSADYNTANPLVAVTAETLQQAGNIQIVETLAQNPALLNSLSGARTSGSNADFGRVGVQLLDLRGLGEDRTLVLVNGRRHVSSLSGSASVDVNTIPVDLIETVDVLTGGASAIYGADGVSGVVNFRLKRNFEGLAASGQIGISSQGDAGQRIGSITVGRNFADGRGNVALSYEFREIDRVGGTARDYIGNPDRAFGLVRNQADFPDDPNIPDRVPTNNLRYADSSVDGALDFDVDECFTIGTCIPDFTGSGKVYDRGRLLRSAGGLTQGGDSTPLAGYQGDLQAYNRVHNVNMLAHYDFSDAVSFYFEGKYVKNRTFTLGQPSFDFFTYLAPDNAYLEDRFGGVRSIAEGALISRDNFDLGVRGEQNDRETIRLVGGFEGRISDHARYDLSYVFGQTKADILLTDYRIGDRYAAAIDAVRDPATGNIVCRSNLTPASADGATTFTPGANSGCLPLNLLGNGVRSQAALDWVNADINNRSRLRQHVVSGAISGDFGQLFELPGGPVGFALGAEYRKESSSFVPDQLLQQGALADFSTQLPETGEFDVKEAFAELSVPLLRDMPFAHDLSFGAALRLSDYSTVGKTTTWKIDGTYAPIRDVTFRGTISEAVRAPNITELFQPSNGTFSFIGDPCDPVFITEGTQFRAANCQATLAAAGLTPAQILAFNPENDPTATVSLPGNVGGNRNLREETARTWTAGVVVRPSFIPGLVASFDWWDIRLKNAINTPDAEEIAELCVDQPSLDNVFCENITRSPTTGFISGYLLQPVNVANFRTAGADFKLNYSFRTSKMGAFSFTLVGGYLDRLEFTPTIGAQIDDDREERFFPKWNATGDITWKMDAVTVNYGVSWFSSTRRYELETLAANPDIAAPENLRVKARWQHDVQVGLDVGDKFNFYFGGNNIWNQQPDRFDTTYPISFVGRYLYAGARIKM
ncbi:MAG: TonB-dependent receptor [Novosphingobium sp. 28-62-57]|uniref:TonB-dependent receptor domain-containing protein n=1 Tax=unclassified Novosphingobium TaxID=2644732 RepID=UPI000BD552C2|nr:MULTISPECIES: TonB-dependent receptor [unclassified Novosphingobium]OYW51315.1 MAG: TonB-dependent receptor [Novosphingobium sp. 12-62-10]OYZ10547.1 MAG: TonB-dependent receptor [Novosphingobium sp. 28-62-57]OZA40323.1 MAG: TonB-dependent receptor [Novosphingobium sp. 17-62-9]